MSVDERFSRGHKLSEFCGSRRTNQSEEDISRSVGHRCFTHLEELSSNVAATECWAETTTHEVVPGSELRDSPIWGPPHAFQLP